MAKVMENDPRSSNESWSVDKLLAPNPQLDCVNIPLVLSFNLDQPTTPSIISTDMSIPVPVTQREAVCVLQEILANAILDFTGIESHRVIPTSSTEPGQHFDPSIVFPDMVHVKSDCLHAIINGIANSSTTPKIEGLTEIKEFMAMAPFIEHYILFFSKEFTADRHYHVADDSSQTNNGGGNGNNTASRVSQIWTVPFVPNPLFVFDQQHQHGVEFLKIMPKIAGDTALLDYGLIKHDRSITIGACKDEARASLCLVEPQTPTRPILSIYVDLYSRRKQEMDMLILEAEALTLHSELNDLNSDGSLPPTSIKIKTEFPSRVQRNNSTYQHPTKSIND
jgi:hypothetical protein